MKFYIYNGYKFHQQKSNAASCASLLHMVRHQIKTCIVDENMEQEVWKYM
jgi:hypothetical protein